jgi:hypothetical protein
VPLREVVSLLKFAGPDYHKGRSGDGIFFLTIKYNYEELNLIAARY